MKSAFTNGAPASQVSNVHASAVTDVSGFVADMKSGFRDNIVRSLVVEDGIVKIQLADAPVKYFGGLIGMTCTFASPHSLRLERLRILDSNGQGWTYPLTPRSCQDVVEHMNNQRLENGRNSFDAFVESNRRLITSLD